MGAPFSIEMVISNHNIGVNLDDAGTIGGLGPDDFARRSHSHSAGDITSGTMSEARLPTATTTAKGVVSLSSSLNSDSEQLAATPRAIRSLKTALDDKANNGHKHGAGDISAGTFQGIVGAQSNTSYTTKQVRNIILSTAAPTSAQGENGDVYLQYDA